MYGILEEKPQAAKPMPVTRMSFKARFCCFSYECRGWVGIIFKPI